MTSDPGVTCQDSDYATQIQEAIDELQQMQEAPRVVRIRRNSTRWNARFEGVPTQNFSVQQFQHDGERQYMWQRGSSQNRFVSLLTN